MARLRVAILFPTLLCLAVTLDAQTPVPLPGNPGNIFIEGQEVVVQLPQGARGHWQAAGYLGKVWAQGNSTGSPVDLGKLPVGFYTVTAAGAPSTVTVGVLARLAAPTPANTPIAIDTAAAGLYNSPDQWRAVANLVSLAGIVWERDRFHWHEIQLQNRSPLVHTRFDDETTIMHNAGLRVLNLTLGFAYGVTHEGLHLPVDLRDPYQFFHDLASRWGGTVDGIEPWNEGDIYNSGAELAGYQKASYLGLKAGNPNILVGSIPWAAAIVPSELEEYQDNDVTPYFDTFNFHHYSPADQLPSRYSTSAVLAGGKPLWVTEFNQGPPPAVDPVTGDPSPADMRIQAQTLVKYYAISIYLNVQRTFFFLLGDSVEDGKQFGIVRKDFTPRPAFVALAAVGRLLAGAKPIAQIANPESPNASIYAFQAVPDGVPSDVLVVWNQNGGSSFHLPVSNAQIYDNIGQRVWPSGSNPPVEFSTEPIFIVLPQGTVNAWAGGRWRSFPHLTLTAPPVVPAPPPSHRIPSAVVLQAVFPAAQMVLTNKHIGPPLAPSSMERASTDSHQQIQIFAYNFSDHPLNINLTVQVPKGWNYSLPVTSLSLLPMARVPIAFDVSPNPGSHGVPGAVVMRAAGINVGDSVLEFHLLP